MESSLESSHIANVLDELRGIPQREAAGEQLDARVAELIDELEEHLAKLVEEKERLLQLRSAAANKLRSAAWQLRLAGARCSRELGNMG